MQPQDGPWLRQVPMPGDHFQFFFDCSEILWCTVVNSILVATSWRKRISAVKKNPQTLLCAQLVEEPDRSDAFESLGVPILQEENSEALLVKGLRPWEEGCFFLLEKGQLELDGKFVVLGGVCWLFWWFEVGVFVMCWSRYTVCLLCVCTRGKTNPPIPLGNWNIQRSHAFLWRVSERSQSSHHCTCIASDLVENVAKALRPLCEAEDPKASKRGKWQSPKVFTKVQNSSKSSSRSPKSPFWAGSFDRGCCQLQHWFCQHTWVGALSWKPHLEKIQNPRRP